MPEYRVPQDTIPEDERIGPVASIGSTISTERDGVEKRRPHPSTSHTYLGVLEDVTPERHLDTVSVCQIALYRLLHDLEMHRKNLEAFLESADLQTSSFRFKRIVIDWPRDEDDVTPMPSAVLVSDGAVTYANAGFGTSIIEETADVYGEGTVLRRQSFATLRIVVYMLFPHKEERRAAHAAIERNLLTEPDDDENFRKVVVPEYYDRTVRIMCKDLARPDGSAEAKTNEWELQAAFDCEVEVVKLVKVPARIQQPRVGLGVGTRVVL